MNRGIAFPFLVIPDGAISMKEWLIGTPGHALGVAGDLLQDWDYARDLEVATTVHLDWNAIAPSLQVPAKDLRLRVALVVGTGAGALPRQQWRASEIVVGPSIAEQALSAVVPGHMLSGRLQLKICLTLETLVNGGGALSPKMRGARLWESVHNILIEDGGNSRFPVELLSFGQAFRRKVQETAPWFLLWQPGQVHLDFSGSVRLYVNSDIPEISSRFIAGDALTLQAMMADVMAQILTSVLDSDDETDLLACGEGSVGMQARHWMEASFPGNDRTTVRSLKNNDPGAYHAAILAAAEIGVAP